MSTPFQQRCITPLSRPTSTIIRSSVVIPTYASFLQELIHNSLDAGAKEIGVWVDTTPGDERIKVEDDGWGISEVDLKRVGERYESSKGVNASGLGSAGHYGFRGEGKYLTPMPTKHLNDWLMLSPLIYRCVGVGRDHNSAQGHQEDSVKDHQGISICHT